MLGRRNAIVVLAALGAGCVGDAERTRQVKQDLQAIDRGLVAYKGKHSVWPDTLDKLAHPPEGGEGFVQESTLTDPWGRAYQYDPTELHPSTQHPLVWS